MVIKHIELQDFRNFTRKDLHFHETTIIVGPNGSGKTNILEAIHLLSTGKSFRADIGREMIQEGKDLARAKGAVRTQDDNVFLEVVITTGKIANHSVASKKVLVNNVSKRLYNFAGNLKTVLFGPWDMNLIAGSPGSRRRFLDSVLSQVDREYYRSLLSYEKGIRQRNKVLEKIREGEANRIQLAFWDRLVIKDGNYLSEAREKFIDFCNGTNQIGQERFEIKYDKSGISEERIEQYANQEVATAATLVGPHRDDVILKAKSYQLKAPVNLATYGSRGEQRMGILWLKLAELAFVEEESGEKPVLLLDDIFSELDDEHRKLVTGIVNQQQTIITTADPHTIESWKKKTKIIKL